MSLCASFLLALVMFHTPVVADDGRPFGWSPVKATSDTRLEELAKQGALEETLVALTHHIAKQLNLRVLEKQASEESKWIYTTPDSVPYSRRDPATGLEKGVPGVYIHLQSVPELNEARQLVVLDKRAHFQLHGRGKFSLGMYFLGLGSDSFAGIRLIRHEDGLYYMGDPYGHLGSDATLGAVLGEIRRFAQEQRLNLKFE